MIVKVIILCAFGSALSQQLIPEEQAKLFPMAGTEVPQYQVIPVSIPKIEKRSTHQKRHVQIQAFGENIDLWLNPIEGILATAETPVYTITKGLQMTIDPNIMKQVIKQMYEDQSKATTINVNELSDGNTELTGIIGQHNMFIHPHKNIYQLLFKRSVDNIPKSECSNCTYHVVYKLPEVSEHMKNLKAPLISSRTKRSTLPNTIYPEIMVIMDNPLFKLLNNNFYSAITYTLAFWNGVDLLYRSLQNPSYRLNIAGIIIATKPDSLEYMQYHLQYHPYDFLIENALEESTSWMLKLENLLTNNVDNNFDVMVTMTSEIFCAIKENTCKRGTIGLAYAGGACSPIIRMQGREGTIIGKIKSAIVHDKASYEGIHTAAHELGHLFGVVHDGEHHKWCNEKDGNIMAPTISFTPYSSDWSQCSIRDFQAFLNKEPVCLYNKPKSGTEIARLLPGKFMDVNEQCKKRDGTYPGLIDESICQVLYCIVLGDPRRMMPGPGAADGTTCGNGKMCLHGQCIFESQSLY